MDGHKTVFKCSKCGESCVIWQQTDVSVFCNKCGYEMDKEVYAVKGIEKMIYPSDFNSISYPPDFHREIAISAYGVFSALDIRRIYPEPPSTPLNTPFEPEVNRLKDTIE